MASFNNKKVGNKYLEQILNRYATYNGSNPYRISALYSVIGDIELNRPAYVVKGGMYRITHAVYRLAQELGVKFEFNNAFKSFIYEKNDIIGIKTEKGKFMSDLSVSCIDINLIYPKLKKLTGLQKFNQKQDLSTSAVVFYWGVKGLPNDLNLHNIFFSNNYYSEYKNINKNKLYDDPTVYVNITRKVNSNDAPENCENWFVMVNVPAGYQMTEEILNKIRANTILKLNRQLEVELDNFIVEEMLTTPKDLYEKTGAYKGALYGQSCNNRLLSFVRQMNKGQNNGLYFGGGTVNPGGGIPLCLLSAKMVETLVKEDMK
jgi:phytoene dehydrogenase-like protein